jgi:hypothetical protein
MEGKMEKKNIIIIALVSLVVISIVSAWMMLRPKLEKPTLEEANVILTENTQNTLELTSFVMVSDMGFYVKDGEVVFLKTTVEDAKSSIINPFDFANQDSSMIINYSVTINFESIIDSIKARMTPEELEKLREPVPTMGIDLLGLMKVVRAVGKANILVTKEMKSIDFDSYTKIVRVEGLREIITKVGGKFLAEMVMGGIAPHLGVWRKGEASPAMKEEMKAMFEPIEKIIPSFFNTRYVREVLPNREVNGITVYNFALGMNFNEVKDIAVYSIPLMARITARKAEMETEEIEEIKIRIIEAWPNIVRILEAIEMDYIIYICRETRFTIKERIAGNINLSELMMVFKEMAPEEEMTPEKKAKFERIVEATKNINIGMTWSTRYNEHNRVPAILSPVGYEVIEPLLPILPR